MTIDVQTFIDGLFLYLMFNFLGLIPSFPDALKILPNPLKYNVSFVVVLEGKIFLDAGQCIAMEIGARKIL